LRRFFDTSVLISAFYKFDPNYTSSAEALRAGTREDSFCALRTLGEVYSVLTGLPVRPRFTGRDGVSVLEQIRTKLTVISLSEDEYVSAIRSISETIVGGAAYDALIARCAVKAKADVLLTWNIRDFTRLGSDVARIVKTPVQFLTP
jgi:predicted nucleic acid-binding protein